MKTTTRREFLAIAGSMPAYLSPRTAWADTLHTEATPYNMVAMVDHKRILTAANRYLLQKPITVTAMQSNRSSGGLHDYFSEGDYWWPDPKSPGGPYIRRDGVSNPENFTAHREALIRLSLIVPALTAAWELTRERKYAEHAGRHLRAWFVDPATRMNANLQYAQAIFGVSKGRGIGIIDTLHLVEPARAATLLMSAQVLEGGKEIQQWFGDYLEWMRTSKNGQEERDARNNHGTCWVLQAGEFARFTQNEEVMSWCRERFRTVLVAGQIAANGSLPLELARTKPYSYSLFDMDVLCGIAQSISTKSGDLWNFATPDGRGLRSLMQFMYRYIKDKAAWPFAHDVEHFEDFPVRNPALLFSGLAYSKQDYITLWKTLNPDPVVPEVIRNFPIRQPLLWMARSGLRTSV
ncbi:MULTISPECIES: alginate lyase family protein [Acidobacteriaceae]|uniref:alginate lyase family protein n=1 Tax=Acidobacteriaceae TaxID=204434 RepID=UPI00131AACC1|nr:MULTISPECIES: alginate lyase family protein [Acidobacteriaceae]MDW5265082.1 alginate lyase family protein [Edaphobacter sp.]